MNLEQLLGQLVWTQNSNECQAVAADIQTLLPQLDPAQHRLWSSLLFKSKNNVLGFLTNPGCEIAKTTICRSIDDYVCSIQSHALGYSADICETLLGLFRSLSAKGKARLKCACCDPIFSIITLSQHSPIALDVHKMVTIFYYETYIHKHKEISGSGKLMLIK